MRDKVIPFALLSVICLFGCVRDLIVQRNDPTPANVKQENKKATTQRQNPYDLPPMTKCVLNIKSCSLAKLGSDQHGKYATDFYTFACEDDSNFVIYNYTVFKKSNADQIIKNQPKTITAYVFREGPGSETSFFDADDIDGFAKMKGMTACKNNSGSSQACDLYVQQVRKNLQELIDKSRQPSKGASL